MRVLATQQPNVQSHPRCIAQALKKVLHQLRIELPNPIGGYGAVKRQMRPTRQIQNHVTKRLI